jgi:hypothetical protein
MANRREVAADTGWEPAQLAEYVQRWRNHASGVTLEQARERGFLFTDQELAERKAYCDLSVLAHHVRAGHITSERGEELAAAIVRGGKPRLTPGEAERINAAPIPGFEINEGDGFKPVTSTQLRESFKRVAKAHPGNAFFDGRSLRIYRESRAGNVAAARHVPRARESRAAPSGRRQRAAPKRDSPPSGSDSDPPPVAASARRSA